MAAATGGRFTTDLGDHTEPLNQYVAIAVDPGTRKTQVHKDLTAPFYEIERAMCEEAKALIERARAQRDLDEARLQQLTKEGARSHEEPDRLAKLAEMAELRQRMKPVPAPPRLLTDDATPERLAALLAENHDVMAIMSAEGGIVGMMGGRYGDKNLPNLDVYLKGHAGDPLRVDRSSDGGHTHFVERPALTLGLMIQPEALGQLAKVPSARGRGLLARFLYSQPECGLGTRMYHRVPSTPPFSVVTTTSFAGCPTTPYPRNRDRFGSVTRPARCGAASITTWNPAWPKTGTCDRSPSGPPKWRARSPASPVASMSPSTPPVGLGMSPYRRRQ